MSEDDRDIDVESADDVPDIGMEATASCQNPSLSLDDNSTVDKRAHHNLLERRRRDHIKDSFHDLRDCIPSLQGEKVSRAHILNKATEYIRQLQKGGSIREGEIDDLELKNEVLEEQVNALEQAKAQGSSQDAEDILQSVAERVCARQKMIEKQQKEAKEQAQAKAERSGERAREGRKATAEHLAGEGSKPRSAMAASGANLESKTSVKGPGDGSGSQLLSNSLNLLHVASNIKNAQTLLSTLQKNLPPNSSLPANIKSLAARVLASPLRAQGAGPTPVHPLPRGVVTATTVPKGSPLTTNLAAALQQQQQQKQQQASSLNIPPRSLSSQIKPTIVPIPSTRTGHSDNAAAVNTNQAPPTSSSSQPSALNSSLSTVLLESVTSPLSSVSVPSQPTQISASLLTQATNLSSQILAANSLHNATGQEISSSPTAITPNTSQDLLAQVSSFLNLPNPALIQPSEHDGLNSSLIHSTLVPEVEPLADDGELLTLDDNSDCAAKDGDILATSEPDEPAFPQQPGDGTKRPATDTDSETLPKKPRMDL